ncbi:MAG: hypothetical protein ACLRZH_06325 [Ruthenibacterium lactatiformans]
MSEETGIISLAKNGVLIRRLDRQNLFNLLEGDMVPPAVEEKNARSGGESMKTTRITPSNASSQANPWAGLKTVFQPVVCNGGFRNAGRAALACCYSAGADADTHHYCVRCFYDYNSALYTGASLDIVKREDTKVSVVISVTAARSMR